MSNRQVAKEFFELSLPDKVKKIIDLNTLTLQSGSFIEPEMKEAFTDILYSVLVREKKGYIYLLCEHQSTPDKWLPFRIARYRQNIMARHLKQSKASYLPLVVPVVLYIGKKNYHYSTDLFDLFEPSQKTLAKELFYQPISLVDVHRQSDDDLMKRQWAGVMQFVQKHIFVRNILPYLERLMPILIHLEAKGAGNYVFEVVQYVATRGNDTVKFDEFLTNLSEKLSENGRKQMRTIADRWTEEAQKAGYERGMQVGMQKGLEQGLEQGLEKGMKTIITRMLNNNISPEDTSKLTGIALDTIISVYQDIN